MRRMRAPAALFIVLLLAFAGQARAVELTNAGGDLRTGWYPDEPSLTPGLVSGGTFGKLWSANVEGQVYAQPLLADGLLLVATEKNKVYGLDPLTGELKWAKALDLGTPWNPADIHCGDLKPYIGVTSTPVVDPSTNTAYLTHKTYASGASGPARWYMDAVDLATGLERPGFPVELAGGAQDAPSRTFSPTTQLQRPGLLLMEGVVYAAFGSHCDTPPWQGWIFGVSTAGKVTARYVDDTTEEGAGIWQSGSGLASDGPGTILFSTGNGGAPAKPTAGNTPPANLGESIVRVDVQPDGSLKPVDFFAPFDAQILDSHDADFASGGVTALPEEYFGTPAIPHLAVAVGKEGYVYLLNRDSLGGIAQGPGGSDDVVQRLGPRGGVWSRPGVWPGEGGYVYIPTSGGAEGGGNLDVYKYGESGTGQPSLALVGSSSEVFGWGSGAPLITSDGTTPGSALVWIERSSNREGANGELRAYDPVPVNGHPVLRFAAPIGTASNYNTPGVGEGRLYVGTRDEKVLAFGSPVISPLSGSGLAFPATTVGKSSEKTLTLTANEALTVTSLTLESTQFTLGLSSPALPAVLAKGQKISVPVKFAPTEAGLLGATVTATTGAGADAEFSLSGTGQYEAAKLMAPRLVSFGATAVGDQSSEPVTLSNIGGTALKIEAVKLPKAPTPFSATGVPPAETTIAPGHSLTMTVEFAPTQAGLFEGEIEVKTSAGVAQVDLSATAGAPGALQISPEANEYGDELLGETKVKSFTITNIGGTAVPITKSKPPTGGSFTALTSLPEGVTVEPGESVTEEVAFTPTEVGQVSGVWQINGEDTSGLHQVRFTGIGVPPPPSTTSDGSTGTSSSSSGASQADSGSFGPSPQQGVLGYRAVAPPVPDVELTSASLVEARGGVVWAKVSCPARERSCAGTISLQRAIAAHLGGPRTATVAFGSFALAGGRVESVKLRLSAVARALLARLYVLHVRALILAHDPSGATHTSRAPLTIRLVTVVRRPGG
jgi:Abnormal spindle-like microcephaly-assoc'd, ASPM-SPD-2-Hydin/PQQ-like domain